MSDKPKWGCGNTHNPDAFCDGSHNNQVDETRFLLIDRV